MPKREDERRRRNKTGEDGLAVTKVDISQLPPHVLNAVTKPDTPENWHPIAKRIFDSLGESGMVVFMEPSDWAMAYLLAEAASRLLKPQPVKVGDVIDGELVYRIEMVQMPLKGTELGAILKGLSSLGYSEGDRRRMKIELERIGEGEEAAVTSIEDARAGLL